MDLERGAFALKINFFIKVIYHIWIVYLSYLRAFKPEVSKRNSIHCHIELFAKKSEISQCRFVILSDGKEMAIAEDCKILGLVQNLAIKEYVR